MYTSAAVNPSRKNQIDMAQIINVIVKMEPLLKAYLKPLLKAYLKPLLKAYY